MRPASTSWRRTCFITHPFRRRVVPRQAPADGATTPSFTRWARSRRRFGLPTALASPSSANARTMHWSASSRSPRGASPGWRRASTATRSLRGRGGRDGRPRAAPSRRWWALLGTGRPARVCLRARRVHSPLLGLRVAHRGAFATHTPDSDALRSHGYVALARRSDGRRHDQLR